MKFNTRENRIHSKPEINSGVTKVEVAGYLSKKKRIDNIILAGERLIQARKDMYDYVGTDLDPDIPLDPTRSKGFDLADASRISQEIASRKAKKPSEPPKIEGEGVKPPTPQKNDVEAVKKAIESE